MNSKRNGIHSRAFDYCEALAKSHYENFPIGWFIPRTLRKYLFAVYAFARTADDFSDEEEYRDQRLERLNDYERRLDLAAKGLVRSGSDEDLLFIAIAETLKQTGLPVKLLKDLLVAFRLDCTKKRYRDFEELQSYCTSSANPIGRIVLHLSGFNDPDLLALSDRICTGIQLVNHWQDLAVDLKKDRIYLPEEDFRRFDYSYEDLARERLNDSFRDLMRFEISRTRSLFYEGRPLLDEIGERDRRLRWQVSLMWLGPMKILKKIEAVDYDLFHQRPTISSRELGRLFLSVMVRGVP